MFPDFIRVSMSAFQGSVMFGLSAVRSCRGVNSVEPLPDPIWHVAPRELVNIKFFILKNFRIDKFPGQQHTRPLLSPKPGRGSEKARRTAD